MPPHLDTLPPELLDLIAYSIINNKGGEDLWNLRTTCRKIQAGTRHCFLRTFFTHRGIRLKEKKLQELRAICEVRDIANSVRRLDLFCCDERESQVVETIRGPSLFREGIAALGVHLTVACRHLRKVDEVNFRPLESRPLTEMGNSDAVHDDRPHHIATAFQTVLWALAVGKVSPKRIAMFRTYDQRASAGLQDDPFSSSCKAAFEHLDSLQHHFLPKDISLAQV